MSFVSSVRLTDEQKRFIDETNFCLSKFIRAKLSATDEFINWSKCQMKN